MEKNIKDYLHLYLGCDVSVTGSRLTYQNNYAFLKQLDSDNYTFGWGRVKPILRPLSDMTEEERNFQGTNFINIPSFNQQTIAEEIRWLLSKDFDLFNLIPEGLAIDKTI